MALFFAALSVAAIVGVYVNQREADGILAAHRFSKYPRWSAALFWTDDLAGAACGAPAVFFLFSEAFAFLAFDCCFGW